MSRLGCNAPQLGEFVLTAAALPPPSPHPPCSWVLFNILGPLQNQLNAMSQDEPAKKATKKRGVAAGLGLTAASLLATQSAEAAQQVADLAAGDNRFGTIALLAVPVLG